MPDLRDPFDSIYDEDPRDPFSAMYDPEPLGLGALAGDIGSEIADAPTHFMGAVGRIWEGLDPEEIWGIDNLADEWIRASEETAQERVSQPGQERPYLSVGGPFREDISGAGASVGASAAAMGLGLGAGIATGAALGPAAGYVAGAGGSAYGAGRQSGNEFLRRAVEMASQSAMEETGEEMTVEQKMQVAAEFIPFAEKHALWEAGTEAFSNVLGFKILATPLKKIFGDRVVTNFLGKSVGILGTELPPETITQIGQKNNEIAAGLSDEDRLEWDNLDSYSQAFREILYPTLLTTAVMGGGVGIGVSTYKAATRDKTSEAEKDKTVRDQIDLNQRIQQAPNVEAAATEAAAKLDEVWAETAIPEEVAIPPEPVKKEELTGRERIARKKAEIERESRKAATSVENEKAPPTPNQIEKGNYEKGHPRIHGFELSIENPKGSIRRSHPDAEHQWEQEMAHDYGYLRGTVGRDKDHLDVFLGDNAADETLPVFVVDQVNPGTGKFDEHKAVFGAASEQEARDIYLANYEKGWQGLKAVTEMSPEVFKEWSRDEAAMQKEASEYETAIEPTAEVQPELLPAPVAKPNRRITPLVTDEDSLIGAVAKLGGISRAEAETQGIDPADFRRARAGIRYAFNNGQKAQSFDGMAETLRQYGWPFEGPNDLLEALSKELGEYTGAPQYTPAGVMAAAERQQAVLEEYEAEYTGDTFESAMPAGEATYPDVIEEEDRSIFEIYTEASKIDSDAAERIFQSGSNDGAVAQGLYDIIKGKAREGKQPPSDMGKGREVQAERPVAEAEGELFGAKDETAQAIKDREVERQRKMAAAPPVEAGEGALFSGEARQADLEDIVGKPQEKPHAREIPEDQEKPEREGRKRQRGKAERGKDLQRPEEARAKARDQEEARKEKPVTLRDRPKAVEKFLASLPPQTVIEVETGEQVEISGAELAEYNALNNRIGALERVLDCIG